MRLRFSRAGWGCGVALLSLTLAACSTTSKPDPVVRPVSLPSDATSELPAQTLAPGECGLFGWDTSSPPMFVFFATAERALYLSGEGLPETLTPVGTFPAADYGPIKLILGAAEPMIEGTRYAQARVTQVLTDGFTRVRPLVILQSCQTLEPSSALF